MSAEPATKKRKLENVNGCVVNAAATTSVASKHIRFDLPHLPSDVVFAVERHTFHVHKFIVAQHSSVFGAMFALADENAPLVPINKKAIHADGDANVVGLDGDDAESGATTPIPIPSASFDTVYALFTHIYAHHGWNTCNAVVTLSDANLESVLRLATEYDVGIVCGRVEIFLMERARDALAEKAALYLEVKKSGANVPSVKLERVLLRCVKLANTYHLERLGAMLVDDLARRTCYWSPALVNAMSASMLRRALTNTQGKLKTLKIPKGTPTHAVKIPKYASFTSFIR